jgi:mono/diheme cytochrome c family protein
MNLDGKGLYDHYCASCHGGLEQSTAARANAGSIQTALQDIPEMQGLPDLPEEQVNSLATALSKVPPGKAKGKP